jgi:hypothetical protein
MDSDDKPKQTTPRGLEIPVPTRDEFLRNMDKAVTPVMDRGFVVRVDGDVTAVSYAGRPLERSADSEWA